MSNVIKHKIGILAFGSLINNPGAEIISNEIDRLDCETPFKVEFARISSSRSNAPTLIPIENGSKGKKVKGKILILRPEINLEQAKSILWRRERHEKDKLKEFKEPPSPTHKNVLIGVLNNFCDVEIVLYTRFLLQPEFSSLNASKLAEFAINSILDKAGEDGEDGVRYLLDSKRDGIITEYSKEYEKEILSKTKTSSLQEAIDMLDKKRIII